MGQVRVRKMKHEGARFFPLFVYFCKNKEKLIQGFGYFPSMESCGMDFGEGFINGNRKANHLQPPLYFLGIDVEKQTASGYDN